MSYQPQTYRLAIVTLIVAGAVHNTIVDTVSACRNPTVGIPCDEQFLNFEALLNRIFSVAHELSIYIGFVIVFGGVILWFGDKREDRTRLGKWLLVGGLSLVILYFGFDVLITVLAYIGGG